MGIVRIARRLRVRIVRAYQLACAESLVRRAERAHGKEREDLIARAKARIAKARWD